MSESEPCKILLQQIAEERARGTRQGRMAIAAVLGMFAIAIGNVYYKVTNFDTELLASEIQRQASTLVWPLVSKELDGIAADAVPAISNALAAEASNFMPKVSERLVTEGEAFQQHVNKKMTASLDAHFMTAMAEHSDALKSRYPQFAANPERYDALIAKLSAHAEQWAQTQLDTTFAQHIVILQSINTTVAALAVEGQDEKQSEKSMDDVMSLFLDIMNTRLEGKG